MLRNRTEVCIVAWFGSFGYRTITVRIFSQAKSFDNKKILNVPRYCKKAKKQKNVEKFLLMTKIAKISMEYRSHFLFKYSSLSVTFDSSRRHKMFSSLFNVCDETKRSPFLLSLKFTIFRVPLTHMRLLTLLILAVCRICAKYERREQRASRRFSVAPWL